MNKKVKSICLILTLNAALYGCSQGMTDNISPDSAQTDEVSITESSSAELTTEMTTEASTTKSTNTDAKKEIDPKNFTDQSGDLPEEESDWCLILVNKDHPVPEDYKVQIRELANGQKIDERIYPFLQAMFDDIRSRGMDLFVREGYRTHEEQQSLMENKIKDYMKEGHSEEEATEIVESYVAHPGTSEHELGISVDINANTEVCEDEKVFKWLDENAYKYGFIKRYAEDKTDITGINNEPWHYRYVGKKAAREIKEQDICLEEYLNE